MEPDDKAIAAEVNRAAADLNKALARAAGVGITVELDQVDGTTMGSPARQVIIVARLQRIIDIQ